MSLDDDDFELFGLPRRMSLQREPIEQRRRELQAAVHPDRFAAQGAVAQRLATQWAMRVNEAYRRLVDPLRRAAALCELAGVAVDEHRNTSMPADFLMRQMQWREALEEATSKAEVQALACEVGQAEAGLQEELVRLLDDRGDAQAAAVAVRAAMFVRRFGQGVEARLDTFKD